MQLRLHLKRSVRNQCIDNAGKREALPARRMYGAIGHGKRFCGCLYAAQLRRRNVAAGLLRIADGVGSRTQSTVDLGHSLVNMCHRWLDKRLLVGEIIDRHGVQLHSCVCH